MEKTIEKKVLSPFEIVTGIHNFMTENPTCELDDIVGSVKEFAGEEINGITKNLIAPLILEFKKLKQEQEEDVAVSVASGMFLQDEPFIPEYLGFKENVIDNENGTARMYQKGDFVLMRNYFENLEKGKDKWVVTKNVGKDAENRTNVFKFDNMLHAVLCLQSMGLGISIAEIAFAEGL